MELQIAKLLIFGLATWRLSALFAYEDGPFEVFARIRRLCGVSYGEDNLPIGNNTLAKGLVCPWCNSVWFGIFGALCWIVWDKSYIIALPLALSALAIVIERLANG